MTELEKEAEQHKDNLRELDTRTQYDVDIDAARMVSFKAGARWQSKQSPWISVEERLPEDGLIDPVAWSVTQKVFVLTSNGNAAISQRRWNCNQSKWEWKGSGSFKDSVVKWMPISELKKGDQNDPESIR